MGLRHEDRNVERLEDRLAFQEVRAYFHAGRMLFLLFGLEVVQIYTRRLELSSLDRSRSPCLNNRIRDLRNSLTYSVYLVIVEGTCDGLVGCL